MPRLICGTNWFLGYSHTSRAKDRFIKELFDTSAKIADVIEVFARHGCNAVMAPASEPLRTIPARGRRRSRRRSASAPPSASPISASPTRGWTASSAA